jgi:DNA-binding MarR family transcriptional regulator
VSDNGHSVVSRARGVVDLLSRREGEPEPRPRFRLLTEADLASLPALLPLIDGVIARNTLVAIVGPHGTFNTFLALSWALSIAIGMEWEHRRVLVGPIVYVFAEGPHGLRKRVDAWKVASGITGPLTSAYFLPSAVTLNDAGELNALLVAIEALPEKPVAIVVDTLARNFAGNENAQEDMNDFVRGCDTLRLRTGATVVVVHHTGWNAERSRGSTSFPAAVDTEVTLSRDGERVTVKCTKQKDAAPFSDITLEAMPVADSLVLVSIGQAPSKLSKNELACLKAVQNFEGDTGAAASTIVEATGLQRSSVYAALNALMDSGYVRKHGRKYRLTDSGKDKLVQLSNEIPMGVQPSAGMMSNDAGGYINPRAGQPGLDIGWENDA